MYMIRIGAINIDTSHPMGFAEVMVKSKRAGYVAVYDDSFRPDEEVEGFMERFGVKTHCSTLEELADLCDIGFIHSCNWDLHLEQAIPFLKRGKPVFIDKPIVGNLQDCLRLEQLCSDGGIILGASSARYCYEIQEFLAVPVEERGEIVQVFGTSGVDEFNYGIHVVEAIGGLLGQGASYVRYAGAAVWGSDSCESYFVGYEDGKSAIYNTYTGVWQPFTITVMTTKTTYQFTIDSSRLYEALINEICNYMEDVPHRLASPGALIESVKIMLAGKASKEQNRAVGLNELSSETFFIGKEFYDTYSAGAGSMYRIERK